MTPSEIHSLVSKHLDGWLYSTENGPCLRERMADAIREAVKQRDKLWADGNETLRHERDRALAEVERIRSHVGCARNQGSTQFCHEAVDLQKKLEAMTQCRDDAVAAAHLAVQEHEAYVAMMHDKGP